MAAQMSVLDKDGAIFFASYILNKLDKSSLAENTTYTLEKSTTSNAVVLKDNGGNTISTVTLDDTKYSEVSSTQNGLMTPALLSKLNGIATGAEVNKIASITINGTAATITNKNVSFTIPTDADIKAIVEAYGYQTSAQVESAITAKGYTTPSAVKKQIEAYGYQTASQVTSTVNAAVAGAGHLTRQKVTALPSTDKMSENVIYLVPNGKTGDNSYTEYMKIDGKAEIIGSTETDLSGYVKDSDIVALTNEELTKIVDDAYASVFTS